MKQLVRAGLSDGEVAAYLGEKENIYVTRQAIHAWRKRNLDEAPRRHGRRVMLPWRVREEHRTLEPARAIRAFARRASGEDLPEAEASRLERVLGFLAEHGDVNGPAVFDYDPGSERGWVVVSRRPGVDRGIVREPDVPA